MRVHNLLLDTLLQLLLDDSRDERTIEPFYKVIKFMSGAFCGRY